MRNRTVAGPCRIAALVLALWPALGLAADWPMWRYDAGRTAVSPHDLPDTLHLQWVRRYPPPVPAWPNQPRLKFDTEYRPVVMGHTLFLASPRSDWVAALDTATGAEKWRTYTDGPVRFAPVVQAGKVYVTSDDGRLYCLDASSGKVLWTVRGAPDPSRKVLGNGRLISTWPARGGPVLAHGRVYFAAGIWPFMGIFVHAVDARTGRPVWCNSGTSAKLRAQPHSGQAFTGPAPQGYLAVNGDRLLVPNGRAIAACFDAHSGSLRYFRLGSTRADGSYFVATAGRFYYNRKVVFDVTTGDRLGSVLGTPVLTPSTIYSGRLAYDAERAAPLKIQKNGKTQFGLRLPKRWAVDDVAIGKVWLRAGKRLYATSGTAVVALDLPADNGAPSLAWKMEMAEEPASMLAADDRLFVVTRKGTLQCFGPKRTTPRAYAAFVPTLHAPDAWSGRAAEVLRRTRVRGGYCLVLGLEDGRLAEELARRSALHVIALDPDAKKVDAVRRRLDATGLYGPRVAVHRGDITSFRFPPHLAGLIVSETGGLKQVGDGPAFVKALLRVLRPYGGVACLSLTKEEAATFTGWVRGTGLAEAGVRPAGPFTLLVRKGPLPGAGFWTHQNADVANTVVSTDRIVKAPLGLLWFGGSTNEGMLPRHGHGPTPQVVGGRLFIEGVDKLRAMDVYTGRVLWERELPGLGETHNIEYHQAGANNLGGNYVSLADGIYVVYKDAGLLLHPATGRTIRQFKLPRARGSAGPPTWGYLGVYKDILLAGADTQRLYDPDFSPSEFPAVAERPERTKLLEQRLADLIAWLGTLKGFKLMRRDKAAGDPYVVAVNLNRLLRERRLIDRMPGRVSPAAAALQEDIEIYLRGKPGARPDDFRLREMNRELLRHFKRGIPAKRPGKPGWRKSWAGASSRRLIAMHRRTGKVLWTVTARQGFLHNAIVAGGGKVFVIDRYPPSLHALMRLSGRDPGPGRLMALDAAKGTPAWSTDKQVFGTWLAYSEAHDALLQSKRPSRDSVDGSSGRRLAVFRGADGTRLWDKDVKYYGGPCMLHGDRIITQGRDCKGEAWELLTGAPTDRVNPITGQTVRWRWQRSYGCGTAVASANLLTFRSGACGYYDLLRDGGTGNLGGFRSGCTSNMIVADGVLAVPDYTRTCSCAYENQASVGLIHDPEVETWTYNRFWNGSAPLKRLGLNLGAPGDRLAPDGTLWLDCPSIGGQSPDPKVAFEPEAVRSFRSHSSTLQGGEPRWVFASGVRGPTRLTLTVQPRPAAVTPGLGKEVEAVPPTPERTCTVRLYFAEPDDLKPGERRFDVAVQGRKVLEGFDIIRAAGGPRRGVVREVKDVKVTNDLVLDFRAVKGETLVCGVEVISEKK